MISWLRFDLFGGASIKLNDKPVPIAAAKSRALLFYLAVNGRSHSRETLAGLLWPEMLTNDAKTNLRQALTKLRKLLPTHLTITRQEVGFAPNVHIYTDVAAFEACVKKGSATDLTPYLEAADLYKGDFLAGFFVENSRAFEDWVLPIRERLRRQALQVLQTLSAHYTARRDVKLGLLYTNRLLMLEPWLEESHQQMMRLLAWDNQYSAALTQYKRCQEMLDAELGVAPNAETTALYERIKQARLTPRPLHPVSPDSFINRNELAEITEWLHDPACRLLSIVGIGGTGKTRLALKVAKQQASFYLDGVHFIELVSLESSEQIVTAIAGKVGLIFSGSHSPQNQLRDYLRQKEILFVLDNIEHLLDAEQGAINLIMSMLQQAPDVRWVVTSREKLNLSSEWVFELKGLPYPNSSTDTDPQSYASVQLFQQTAQRTNRRFNWAKEQTAVIKICQLVEGLPLGIKLAATLVRYQTCAQIAQAVTTNMDVLASTMHDIPSRQRSLRATFDYSWRLLKPAEQKLLACLSVFRGTFTLDAAEFIAGATLLEITILVDKSLLNLTQNERFELHTAVREFAADKAVGQDRKYLQQRFSTYYLQKMADLETELQGIRVKATLEQVKINLANVRQAWKWGIVHNLIPEMLSALPTLTYFYALAGSSQEGIQLIEPAITHTLNQRVNSAPSAEALLVDLLVTQATLFAHHADFDKAIMAAEQALSRAQLTYPQAAATAFLRWGVALRGRGDLETAVIKIQSALQLATNHAWLPGQAAANQHLGELHRLMGQFNLAEKYCQQGLMLARQIKNWRREGACLELLGDIAHNRGNFLAGKVYSEQALTITRAIGDQRGESRVLNSLALTVGSLGDFEQAQMLAEQSLRIDQQLGEQHQMARKLNNLGLQAMNSGNPVDAQGYYERTLAIDRTFGNRLGEGIVLGNLGDVALSMGRYTAAQQTYEQALQIRREISDQRGESWMLCSLSLLACKKSDYQTALAYGEEALLLTQALQERSKEGYAWTHLGHAHCGLGSFAEAQEAYATAVAIRRELAQKHLLIVPIAGLAYVASIEKDWATAHQQVEAALELMKQQQFGGTRESGGPDWACYQVLKSLDDARAAEVLETAVLRIQTVAARIKERTSRDSYLQNVSAHRQLLAAWQENN